MIDLPTTMSDARIIIENVNYDSDDDDDLEEFLKSGNWVSIEDRVAVDVNEQPAVQVTVKEQVPQQQPHHEEEEQNHQQQQQQQQQQQEHLTQPDHDVEVHSLDDDLEEEEEEAEEEEEDEEEEEPDHSMKKCFLCDFVTPKMHYLMQHTKSHRKCDKCDMPFSGKNSRRNLDMHLKICQKVHQCQKCWKIYDFKSYLDRHIEMTCNKKLDSPPDTD
jgi:hypothetical protein